jgi:hypothetical protein
MQAPSQSGDGSAGSTGATGERQVGDSTVIAGVVRLMWDRDGIYNAVKFMTTGYLSAQQSLEGKHSHTVIYVCFHVFVI